MRPTLLFFVLVSGCTAIVQPVDLPRCRQTSDCHALRDALSMPASCEPYACIDGRCRLFTEEMCDGADNDCDGIVDEGALALSEIESEPLGVLAIGSLAPGRRLALTYVDTNMAPPLVTRLALRDESGAEILDVSPTTATNVVASAEAVDAPGCWRAGSTMRDDECPAARLLTDASAHFALHLDTADVARPAIVEDGDVAVRGPDALVWGHRGLVLDDCVGCLPRGAATLETAMGSVLAVAGGDLLRCPLAPTPIGLAVVHALSGRPALVTASASGHLEDVATSATDAAPVWLSVPTIDGAVLLYGDATGALAVGQLLAGDPPMRATCGVAGPLLCTDAAAPTPPLGARWRVVDAAAAGAPFGDAVASALVLDDAHVAVLVLWTSVCGDDVLRAQRLVLGTRGGAIDAVVRDAPMILEEALAGDREIERALPFAVGPLDRAVAGPDGRGWLAVFRHRSAPDVTMQARIAADGRRIEVTELGGAPTDVDGRGIAVYGDPLRPVVVLEGHDRLFVGRVCGAASP